MHFVRGHFQSVFSILAILVLTPFSSVAEDAPDANWKLKRIEDGRTVLSDGTLTVTFPADAKVEIKGSYVSASIEQETGDMLNGLLRIERKDAPAEAKKAADPRKWLEGFVRDKLESDRKSVKSDKTNNYNNVTLVKTGELMLGEFKGLKSITDHERNLGNLRIEGGMHGVEETNHYVIGDHFYLLSAYGSGAPQSKLFPNNTSFHRSEMAQKFLKSAKLLK